MSSYKTFCKVASSPYAIFMVALLVRVRILRQLLPEGAWRNFYANNEAARIAWLVASGFGFSSPWPHTPFISTAQQPPIYPYLLAAIFRLFGSYSYTSLWIASLLNAISSALTAVLLVYLGKRDFSEPAGILAGWLWASWFYLAMVSIRLWESSLSTLLLMLSLVLVAGLMKSLRVWVWILFGALAGTASLTDTSLFSVFACLWILSWLSHYRRGRSSGRCLMASVGVCLLTVLPWTIRNYEVFHRFIPVRDNLGLELWVGNHQGVTYLHDFSGGFPLGDPEEYNQMGEIKFVETKRATALQFISHYPRQFLRLVGQRVLNYWTAPSPYLWFTMSLLAWTGAVAAAWRRQWVAMPYLIVMLVYPVIYYITHSWPTYRHPVEPTMVLLSVYAVITTLSCAARERGPEAGSIV
jgi:4-amino-4-deoxy-L-arabinose transferase-like glycosyltransferase